jgi:hypothetical protein
MALRDVLVEVVIVGDGRWRVPILGALRLQLSAFSFLQEKSRELAP